MDEKNSRFENASLEQFGVTVHPDLRLEVFRGSFGIEVHLAPGDAVDIALLLFRFAYEIPGKHRDVLRTLAGFNQPEDQTK